MAQPNDYHLQYTFEPLNFSAPITLKTVTDGSVYNYNVARYRNLTAKHFQVTALSAQENKTVIEVCTNQSNLSVRETSLITGDFWKRSHYDSRRSGENRPSGDRDGAPRNALYARKTSLCTSQPRRTKLAGTVYAEGLFCGRRSGKAPALGKLFGNKPTLPWQAIWCLKTFTDSQLSLAGFGFAF